ncbi:hypothetical protein Droror1_Dr00025005 [Drosera rotundifolia]
MGDQASSCLVLLTRNQAVQISSSPKACVLAKEKITRNKTCSFTVASNSETNTLRNMETTTCRELLRCKKRRSNEPIRKWIDVSPAICPTNSTFEHPQLATSCNQQQPGIIQTPA